MFQEIHFTPGTRDAAYHSCHIQTFPNIPKHSSPIWELVYLQIKFRPQNYCLDFKQIMINLYRFETSSNENQQLNPSECELNAAKITQKLNQFS